MATTVSRAFFLTAAKLTPRPYGAIVAVEKLAKLLNEAQQPQFAMLESCPSSTVAPTSCERAHVRVALFAAVALAWLLLRS